MIGKSTRDRQESKQAIANGIKERPLLTSLGLTHIYGAVDEQKSNQHIHEAILYVQNASCLGFRGSCPKQPCSSWMCADSVRAKPTQTIRFCQHPSAECILGRVTSRTAPPSPASGIANWY